MKLDLKTATLVLKNGIFTMAWEQTSNHLPQLLLLLGRAGVRTDERAPRCPCQSGSDWTDCSRVLP